MRRSAAFALALLMGACAPKTIPAPVITTPKFPDFVAPVVPPALEGTPAAIDQDRGWRFLQSGDAKTAEREFQTALSMTPSFYPATIGLGYVALARKDPKAALPEFDRALEQNKDDVSALVGRGETLVALNRDADAVAAYEAALAVDPSLAEIRRRVDVMKFRSLEGDLSRARAASRAGKLDEAIAAYQLALASSPDSAVLYRELGVVERRQGDLDRALEHLRRAIALDPTDAASQVQIGDILDARGDADGARRAYEASLAIEPSDAVEAKVERLRDREALARLPAEYRDIPAASQITRADLAALIGVRLGSLLQTAPSTDGGLITDVRSSWAAPWIIAVSNAGVMEPFANHAFQPRTVVRRVDLAQVASRLLARIAAINPAAASAWQDARAKFTDLSPSHLAYVAASQAVAAAVMQTGPNGAFQPSRPVTGAEAVQAMDRLDALAGTAPARGRLRR